MNNKQQILTTYLTYCQYQKQLNPKTIRAYKNDLNQFISLYQFKSLELISAEDLEKYLYELHAKYKPKTVKRKIASIKTFFQYLFNHKIITTNPWHSVDCKFREPQSLPRTITTQNISTLLSFIYSQIQNAKTSYQQKNAVRDVAICELLYATGIRIFELCSLSPEDINLNDGIILIHGKGAKERLLHICNDNVLKSLKEYSIIFSEEISQCNHFFVNQSGRPFSEQAVRRMLNRYSKSASISQHITPHMWRHTFATALLEADVDIRYIQKMLGHSSIHTTEIYTHVSMAKQREILKSKHPRNNMML